MLELFRATKIGYYTIAISGILGGFIFFHFWFPTDPIRVILLGILLGSLWLILTLAVCERIARKKLLKIDQLLTNECDVDTYVAIYEALSQRRVNQTAKTYALLNLAAGYLFSGKKTEALHALSRIQSFPKNANRVTYEFSYHNFYFSYHLQTNDLPAATEALAQLENLLQNQKWKKSDQNHFWTVYLEKQCLLQMAKGNYEGCEQVFDLAYKRGESTLYKVVAKYTLAKIYLHDNRNAEAKEALTYVLTHGGSSRYTKSAREQLEAIGNPLFIPPAEIPLPTPPEKPPTINETKHQPDVLREEPYAHSGFSAIFHMNTKERKQYNFVILVLFAALFSLYGGMGAVLHLATDFAPFAGLPPLLGALASLFVYGLLGGWGFTGLVGGIWLGSRYLGRQSKGLIVLALVLFMLTLQLFWLVGLFVTIPFAIYNAVLLRQANP